MYFRLHKIYRIPKYSLQFMQIYGDLAEVLQLFRVVLKYHPNV
jgi:hypothetical protein